MKITSLNGKWHLFGNKYDCYGTIPGSVYSFLLDNHLMENPFYRDNELKALELISHEYSFSRSFSIKKSGNPMFLCCDGLDTLCTIFINGEKIAAADNMHRRYRFDITNALKSGNNEIKITFYPIDPYIKEKEKKNPILSATPDAMQGFSYLRKAHCMLGWDWGPRLPDAGIWRDIYILEKDSAEITDFHIIQRHENGRVYVLANVETDESADIAVMITAPDGKVSSIEANKETEIENPLLWWPNGLGEQNIYTFRAELQKGGNICDFSEKKIGFRTMELVRERDKYGESFYHRVNGVAFFAMGADYIPEDNIFSRITPERSRTLLQRCIDANFNAIRVWGGGYYPDNWFFDLCDEMGLVVFFDLMFACTTYNFDNKMKADITAEITDNLTRLRHHASIAILSGNNEIESFYYHNANPNKNQAFYQEYIEVFEDIIPNIIKKVCPYIPYSPSSPTACGHFIDPDNEDYGDSHYWDVWHGNKPFTEYRKHYFRYLSEFGFQSFPCEKTVRSFTEEGDRNIFSRIMEKHQRNASANSKILSYLASNFLYPTEFGTLLYASQLLQAEAIKYGVEHMRRNRGRCMGSLYWQLNDIWPVASWSSIDYYGRLKALHYFAKRFYAPILISCVETGERTTRANVNCEESITPYETKAHLFVTNDTFSVVDGTLRWALRNSSGEVLKSGTEKLIVAPMSVSSIDEIDFNKTDFFNNYISYSFEINEETVSEGTSLFTVPKYYNFKNPKLRYEISKDEITIYADSYARQVEIDSPDSDFLLSDNYFDMNAGSKTIKILEGTPVNIKLRSVYDIR